MLHENQKPEGAGTTGPADEPIPSYIRPSDESVPVNHSKFPVGPRTGLPGSSGIFPLPASILPTIVFIANCLNCKRDTLFAGVIDKGRRYWFCSACGQYTEIAESQEQ